MMDRLILWTDLAIARRRAEGKARAKRYRYFAHAFNICPIELQRAAYLAAARLMIKQQLSPHDYDRPIR